MTKIFVGFLLSALSIKLNGFDILPDFVGYFLVYRGMQELSVESPRFGRTAFLALLLSAYSLLGLLNEAGNLFLNRLIVLVVSFFDADYNINFDDAFYTTALPGILAVIFAAVLLYLSWQIVKGVQDIERKHGIELWGQPLEKAWTTYAVCRIISVLFFWIPAANVFMVLLAFIALIYFLVKLYQSKKAFEALPKESAEE